MNIQSLHQEPINSVPKREFKRGKPSRRTRSEASPEVRKEVYERSRRACERCDRARASQLAHIERRWKSENKPTKEDFVDLCVPCHTWVDKSEEGRQWLLDFQIRLREKDAG